jgi:hypothetical protein
MGRRRALNLCTGVGEPLAMDKYLGQIQAWTFIREPILLIFSGPKIFRSHSGFLCFYGRMEP